MSPASQGSLEVERYIGTCLISKEARHANGYVRYPHGGPGAWSGVPLIAVVHPRRNRNGKQPAPPQPGPEGRSPLSRLAIHTQGAPLILGGRHPNGNRKNGHPVNGQSPGQAKTPPLRPFRGLHKEAQPPAAAAKQAASPVSSDTLSVASDESSGHSENSLPRIIKPRKRRKKDRKPPPLGQAALADQPPGDHADSPVPTVSLKALGKEQDDHAARETTPDEPKLHHEFDEVKEHDDEGLERGLLLCQCRYCDPAGLIWDVDQNCYSPFLTPPSSSPHLSTYPMFGSSLFSELRDLRSSDLLLRRSWSEPSPSRKDSERSDSPEEDRRVPSTSPSHQALEVSSEIVTSHNGHRDIEIKFFSAPTPSSSPTAGSCSPPEPVHEPTDRK